MLLLPSPRVANVSVAAADVGARHAHRSMAFTQRGGGESAAAGGNHGCVAVSVAAVHSRGRSAPSRSHGGEEGSAAADASVSS